MELQEKIQTGLCCSSCDTKSEPSDPSDPVEHHLEKWSICSLPFCSEPKELRLDPSAEDLLWVLKDSLDSNLQNSVGSV